MLMIDDYLCVYNMLINLIDENVCNIQLLSNNIEKSIT